MIDPVKTPSTNIAMLRRYDLYDANNPKHINLEHKYYVEWGGDHYVIIDEFVDGEPEEILF